MAKKIDYMKDYNSYGRIQSLIEQGRIIDTRDPKWGHPVCRDAAIPWYSEELGASSALYNPDTPNEEKIKLGDEMTAATMKGLSAGGEVEHTCDISTYKVSGCVEEPDAPEVEVFVYRPKNLKKKKARCMFYCMGGALTMVEPAMFPIEDIACTYKCVVVASRYRKSYEAKYPAAVNDLHAAFQWMLDNAESLQIHPDNIVIHGVSSGGHLALSLGFRLKRYGYTPKGIVAVIPQTDDREDDKVSIFNTMWDSVYQHDALLQWLGRDFGSSRVGPEALANHATVEDCIGYPPTFIHTAELDPDRNYNREFYGKLLEAKTFAEYHCWGGGQHSGGYWIGAVTAGELNDVSRRVKVVLDGNIEDCFNYDLRRPWVVEEHNAVNGG